MKIKLEVSKSENANKIKAVEDTLKELKENNEQIKEFIDESKKKQDSYLEAIKLLKEKNKEIDAKN